MALACRVSGFAPPVRLLAYVGANTWVPWPELTLYRDVETTIDISCPQRTAGLLPEKTR